MSLLPLCWTYLDGEGGELHHGTPRVSVAPAALGGSKRVLWDHVACRGCHLDHVQLDYGCNSRNFQQRWLLAFSFRFVDQLALFSGGRPRHKICRAWYQEYEALLRETLG